jgi:hypothetical protein
VIFELNEACKRRKNRQVETMDEPLATDADEEEDSAGDDDEDNEMLDDANNFILGHLQKRVRRAFWLCKDCKKVSFS